MKRIFLFFTLLTAVCTLTRAQDLKPVLNYSVAQKILSGSIAYADSAKLNLAIAIYDNDAQLVSFARMTGASLGASKVAQWKGVSGTASAIDVKCAEAGVRAAGLVFVKK